MLELGILSWASFFAFTISTGSLLSFQVDLFVLSGTASAIFPSSFRCIYQIHFQSLFQKLLFFCCPRGEIYAWTFKWIYRLYCWFEALLHVVCHIFDEAWVLGTLFFASNIFDSSIHSRRRMCAHVIGLVITSHLEFVPARKMFAALISKCRSILF